MDPSTSTRFTPLRLLDWTKDLFLTEATIWVLVKMQTFNFYLLNP